jgi:WS/DGAT/MGAT family acyltransferase
VSDNRVAIYSKMHHALLDGVSGMRLLQRSLSTDPDDLTTPMPWANVRPKRPRPEQAGAGLAGLPMAGLRLAGDLVGVLPTMARMAEQGLRHQATALPGQAPRSMFNVGITGSRRFAAQSWSLERIRTVAKRADATINDVMLAMCSGALRTYLIEQDALPDSSLVAMTPVSLRSDDGSDDGEAGNAVGTILCHLGTDRAAPAERLDAVRASMRAGKAAFAGLNQTQATALSAVIMAPLGLNSLLGLHRVSPPPFNLVISNVPGPRDPLYWRGARLQGLYPLSIPLHGQAMNITVVSYTGELQFGIVGCRRTVPHLQRLLAHLEAELSGLEATVG